MIEYSKLYKIVKEKQSKERFAHTLRVVQRAIEYAKIYKVNIEQARLVALCHDIAKDLKDFSNYYDLFDDIEKINYRLQHAKVGYILARDFGFSEDMLNAIKYHTTGRENMSILEKIIYLADATEDGRSMGKEYVNLVKENIDEAMVEITKMTISYLIQNNIVIHLDTVKCYNYYRKLLDR